MELLFRNARLRKRCNSRVLAVREWGQDTAKKLFQRLAELKAASTLADVFRLPGARCHSLKGSREGQFAVDLKHPYRLVFTPEGEIPRRQDGGIDLGAITGVIILGVEDYH